MHPHGVAVRAGHHCCQVLMRRLGVVGTLRASLALYSEAGDMERLVEGLSSARKVLAS